MATKDDERTTYIFENQKLRGEWFYDLSFENGATWSAKTDIHKDQTIKHNIRLSME